MLRPEKIDYDLGARILSGEATAEEVTAHEKWLAADPVNRQEWDEMVHSWNSASDALRFHKVDVNEGWNQVKHQIKPITKPAWYNKKVFKRMAVAAAFVFLIAAASVLWLLSPADKINYREIVVKSSLGEDIVLPDGSLVTLNAKSSISYTSPFNPDQRIVHFNGEAFFQVEGDTQWPFIIETNEITVKVTGTSFNVRSWPNQKASYVDVNSGIVEVMPKTGTYSPLQITSGVRAVYHHYNGLLEQTESDPNYKAWKTHQIEFQNTPLSQVFETIENVYGVKIQVTDASILEEYMGATFSHNSLEYITNVVCTTFNLDCTSKENVLFFSRKESD